MFDSLDVLYFASKKFIKEHACENGHGNHKFRVQEDQHCA